jgi:hypothetical protein
VEPAIFGYQMEFDDDTTFDERDSVPFMPKCVVVDPNFDWKGQPNRNPVPWDHTILYETHVRGITKKHPKCRRSNLAPMPGSIAKLSGIISVPLAWPLSSFCRVIVSAKTLSFSRKGSPTIEATPPLVS